MKMGNIRKSVPSDIEKQFIIYAFSLDEYWNLRPGSKYLKYGIYIIKTFEKQFSYSTETYRQELGYCL